MDAVLNLRNKKIGLEIKADGFADIYTRYIYFYYPNNRHKEFALDLISGFGTPDSITFFEVTDPTSMDENFSLRLKADFRGTLESSREICGYCLFLLTPSE